MTSYEIFGGVSCLTCEKAFGLVLIWITSLARNFFYRIFTIAVQGAVVRILLPSP